MTVNYYFLLCPNNSGTTVMSQYLATQTGAYLPPYGNNEGQMVPGVREMMRKSPWNPDSKMDWPAIREEWDKLRGALPFVEGSPPNIQRVSAIREVFDHDSKMMFAISNPYLQIASTIYNYRAAPLNSPKLNEAITSWITKAESMRRNVTDHPDIPLVKYEEFCADQTKLNAAFGLDVVEEWSVAGKKGTGSRQIEDRTYHTAMFLSTEEIQQISDVLEDHRALMDFFGYTIFSGAEFVRAAWQFPEAVHSGTVRRIRWEGKAQRSKSNRAADMRQAKSKARKEADGPAKKAVQGKDPAD